MGENAYEVPVVATVDGTSNGGNAGVTPYGTEVVAETYVVVAAVVALLVVVSQIDVTP